MAAEIPSLIIASLMGLAWLSLLLLPPRKRYSGPDTPEGWYICAGPGGGRVVAHYEKYATRDEGLAAVGMESETGSRSPSKLRDELERMYGDTIHVMYWSKQHGWCC